MTLGDTELGLLQTQAHARVNAWLVATSDEALSTETELFGAPKSVLLPPEMPEEVAPAADVLDGVRVEGESFEFTRKLLEAVIGASDPFAAALGLREVSKVLPETMPKLEKLAVRVGGIASLGLPWAVLPIARKVLRERLSHLVLVTHIPRDSSDEKELQMLRSQLSKQRNSQAERPEDVAGNDSQQEVVFALTGAPVLGAKGARKQQQRLNALITVPEATHVSVDIARLVPETFTGMWALDHDAQRGAQLLHELFETAAEHNTVITIEPRNHRGALLSVAALVHALKQPGLEHARVGITLAAELPEAVQQAATLATLSAARVAAGGQPIEITVATPLSIGHEQIASIHNGLAVATLENNVQQRAAQLRIIDSLLSHEGNVQVVAASDDAHLLAAATLLAEQRGATEHLTLQLRAGIAPELEQAISDNGYRVRRRLPVATPREFNGLLDYLIALAAESSHPDSALARTRQQLADVRGEGEGASGGPDAAIQQMFELATAPAPVSRRVQHRGLEFDESVRDTVVFYREPASQPVQDTGGLTAAVLKLTRAHTGELTFALDGPELRIPITSSTGFANEPDTDASKFDNRNWARDLLERAHEQRVEHLTPADGAAGAAGAPVQTVQTAHSVEDLENTLHTLISAEQWRNLRPSERAARLARFARRIAAARDTLTVALAAENGSPVTVIDRDVNNTIDTVRYLAAQTPTLGSLRGATFQPHDITLVVAGAGVPLAERCEAMLAAIATGSSVLMLAHPSVAKSSAALQAVFNEAGLPDEVLTVCQATAAEHHETLAMHLAADERIHHVLIHGERPLAIAMLKRRPELSISARFRGHGVSVVTPSADLDQAARDIVASAFAAGHRDPRRAQVVVLQGTVAKSQRLLRFIEDATTAIVVGDSAHPRHSEDPLTFTMGPLPEPPGEAGLNALTQLAEGERWLVQPEQLDTEGMLWKPGVRVGVKPDARFWSDASGMPVIGITTALTVHDAITLSNELGAGGVAAMHSNDAAETLPFIEQVQAASVLINRATTGARVERQPDAGWGRAGLGSAVMRGGPNRLLTMGNWTLQSQATSSTLHLRGLKPEVALLIEAAQSALNFQQFDLVRSAALADALSWRSGLGGLRDVSGLGIERNILRHLPVSTHVRLAEGTPLAELVRVIAAGLVAGAPMSVSSGSVLPTELSELLNKLGVGVMLELDQDWLERIAVAGPGDESGIASRVRLIGADRTRTAEWMAGQTAVSLWSEPVTMAGPVELLAFVREQSITITANRHGLAVLPDGIGAWISEHQARV